MLVMKRSEVKYEVLEWGETERRGENTVSTAGFLLLLRLSLHISLLPCFSPFFLSHLPSVHPGIPILSVGPPAKTENPRSKIWFGINKR